MRTSNDDAKSFNKLALIASAAATAAFVISQTRLLQRLMEPQRTPRRAIPAGVEVAEEPSEPVTQDGFSVSLPEAPETSATMDDGHDGRGNSDEGGATPPSGAARLRFRTDRPARERLHYGLPVRHHRRRGSTPAAQRAGSLPAEVAVRSPQTEPGPEDVDEDAFDAEYLAICQAIARDGYLDDDPVEEALEEQETAPILQAKATQEEPWWLPAPRLQYILAALAFVAVAAAVGSDPVTLIAEGLAALTTVNTAADLILLSWALCGLVVIVPLGAIAARLVSLAMRGRLARARFLARDSVESAGWGIRLLATSAFVAGAVLYSPHALSWALDTDYPLAAVTTSSMSPALQEGELLVLRGIEDPSELRIGDIIAFRHEDGIAVRRIVGFDNDAIVARADASPDEQLLVALEDVAGKVMRVAGTEVKLPLLGSISLLGEKTAEPAGSLTRLP